MDLRRIEEAALNSWPAFQQMLFDGWVLRFAQGYTKRANSITPLYQENLPLLEKIQACEELYFEKGLPPVFRLTSLYSEKQSDRLETILEQQKYQFLDLTVVLSLELKQLKQEFILQKFSPEIEFYHQRIEDWIEIFHQLKESKNQFQHKMHQKLIHLILAQKCLMILKQSEIPIACGLGVLEQEYLGLFDLVVAPSHRNQGVGRKVMMNFLKWGLENGAKFAYLQVLQNNSPALSLYKKIGFQQVYQYWYRLKGKL